MPREPFEVEPIEDGQLQGGQLEDGQLEDRHLGDRHAEIARAKINLTLRVHGRRNDGYHELESLVAFAAIGDRLVGQRMAAGRGAASVAVCGPFGTAIVGTNLVDSALRLIEAACGRPLPLALELDKRLPVASGIGGGSADAAAALRLVRRAFHEIAAAVDWMAIARQLGADVPVCLECRTALMRGTGERLVPMPVPPLHVVLANPGVPVPADKTRRVFSALAARPLEAQGPPSAADPPPVLGDRAALLAHLREVGNDLEAPATRVLPALAEVKAAVAATKACEHAALSGAGPTVVGIYPAAGEAATAAAALRRTHPGWWVAATVVGDIAAVDPRPS